MRFTDGHLPLPLGSKDRVKQDYLEWVASVRAHAWLPDYKLRRLWKMNYSLADIQANRHWRVWPPRMTRAERRDKFIPQRGPALSRQRIEAMGLRAMRKEFERIVDVHRLERADREWLHRSILYLQERTAELDKRGHKRGAPKPVAFSETAAFENPLQEWFEWLLSRGRLPGKQTLYSSQLLGFARQQQPRLRDVTATALGIFLRKQRLLKIHAAKGNAWQFKSLTEHRARWIAAHGPVAWEYQGEDWLLT